MVVFRRKKSKLLYQTVTNVGIRVISALEEGFSDVTRISGSLRTSTIDHHQSEFRGYTIEASSKFEESETALLSDASISTWNTENSVTERRDLTSKTSSIRSPWDSCLCAFVLIRQSPACQLAPSRFNWDAEKQPETERRKSFPFAVLIWVGPIP